jgi:hypothetical protein
MMNRAGVAFGFKRGGTGLIQKSCLKLSLGALFFKLAPFF